MDGDKIMPLEPTVFITEMMELVVQLANAPSPNKTVLKVIWQEVSRIAQEEAIKIGESNDR
jgi:hypothetical protein